MHVSADERTHTQNTVGLTVTVHYPFHPLCGQELRVACRTHSHDGVVTVLDLQGKGLKIPIWMTSPEAARHKLSDHAAVDVKALQEVDRLIRPPLPVKGVSPSREQE
jgi:hypothetical protein